MNPFDLDATGLLVWGLVAHLIADFPLQNDWMARWKAVPQHPAAIVHAAIHGALLALVFGWPAALLALVHMAIDTRTPVARWSRLVRQTQPADEPHYLVYFPWRHEHSVEHADVAPDGAPMLVDVGTLVRFATDQVFHVATIALAALLIA